MKKKSQPCEVKRKEHSRRNSWAKGQRPKLTWSLRDPVMDTNISACSCRLPTAGVRVGDPAHLTHSCERDGSFCQIPGARTSRGPSLCEGRGGEGGNLLQGNPLPFTISYQKLLFEKKPLLIH